MNTKLNEKIMELLKGPIYDQCSKERKDNLLSILQQVTAHHYQNCIPYRKFCQKRSFDPRKLDSIEDLPFLPASIFKDTLLLSIPPEDVFREIRSSATSSGRPSRIGLDKSNNQRWSFSLQRMLLERIGNQRYRTLVLDDESSIGRSSEVSARASMTRSLLFSSSEIETCLVSDKGGLRLDRKKFDDFFSKVSNDGEGTMLFGFTFILYTHVVKQLLEEGKRYHLPKIIIIHAGGWKKLEEQKLTEEKLINSCCECFGTKPENVIDIYGFSEQGGLLYPTCEHGRRHTPAWSDVICRDPLTLEPAPPGNEGLMQYVTPIQTSYPGHSVLTEDIGYIVGYDDCPCGRKGTTFKILGRSQTATEERGCGDIMANLFA